MIHTASLVHDDVLDECSTRRGCATVNSTYGSRLAVLVGDFLFAQSSWALANLENMEVIKLISQVIADFANGEISQAGRAVRHGADSASLHGQVLLQNRDPDRGLCALCRRLFRVRRARESGDVRVRARLGLAFQVVDDVLTFPGRGPFRQTQGPGPGFRAI